MKLLSPIAKFRMARALALAAALLIAPPLSTASTFISVNFAPPLLPVYVQPIAPGPNYIWIPGYWAWNGVGYYWVPGTWVLAPYVGALWTPGWWGWGGAAYVWHPGYWGPRVGYYGGINYGFGYFGVGYAGGYWSGGRFFYNTAVTHVDVTRIQNTYSRTIVENNVRISYNGGNGGVRHEATAEERLAERDVHRPATQLQVQHERFASTNRQQFATNNNGTPAMAASPRAYNRAGTMETRTLREANVQRGAGGPQGQHETIRAERGGAPMGQPQVRNFEQPHAGGPPHENAAHMQGGPQGRPEGAHQGGPQGRPEGGHPGGHREGGGERQGR